MKPKQRRYIAINNGDMDVCISNNMPDVGPPPAGDGRDYATRTVGAAIIARIKCREKVCPKS